MKTAFLTGSFVLLASLFAQPAHAGCSELILEGQTPGAAATPSGKKSKDLIRTSSVSESLFHKCYVDVEKYAPILAGAIKREFESPLRSKIRGTLLFKIAKLESSSNKLDKLVKAELLRLYSADSESSLSDVMFDSLPEIDRKDVRVSDGPIMLTEKPLELERLQALETLDLKNHPLMVQLDREEKLKQRNVPTGRLNDKKITPSSSKEAKKVEVPVIK